MKTVFVLMIWCSSLNGSMKNAETEGSCRNGIIQGKLLFSSFSGTFTSKDATYLFPILDRTVRRSRFLITANT